MGTQLRIELKRFRKDAYGITTKNNRPISLGEGKVTMKFSDGTTGQFEIKAVLNHSGHLDGGHYFTTVQDEKDKPVLANDTQRAIAPSDIGRMHEVTGYNYTVERIS